MRRCTHDQWVFLLEQVFGNFEMSLSCRVRQREKTISVGSVQIDGGAWNHSLQQVETLIVNGGAELFFWRIRRPFLFYCRAFGGFRRLLFLLPGLASQVAQLLLQNLPFLAQLCCFGALLLTVGFTDLHT